MADYSRDDDDDDEELAKMQADIEKQEREAKELSEIANAVSGTHPATLPSTSTNTNASASSSSAPGASASGSAAPGGVSGSATGAAEGDDDGEVDVTMGETETREEVDARSVHVGNVDYAATPEEIQQFFQACGAINRVTILCDKFTGHPKGYAYVEFADVASVANAVVLNESTFRARQLSVQQKRTNQPAFQRGGGGRGGGRGRGRGGYRGGFRARGGFSPYGRGRGRGRGASTY